MPDSEWVMLCFDDQAGEMAMEQGQFLLRYDADAMGGLGLAERTHEPAKARSFSSAMEGFGLWKQVSTVRPIRADGKPNRPLSAYTITMIPLHEALAKYAARMAQASQKGH